MRCLALPKAEWWARRLQILNFPGYYCDEKIGSPVARIATGAILMAIASGMVKR